MGSQRRQKPPPLSPRRMEEAGESLSTACSVCQAGGLIAGVLLHVSLVEVDGGLRDGAQNLVLAVGSRQRTELDTVLVVLGDVLDELVRALQVGPADVLARQLAGALVEDEVDGNVGSVDVHGCLVAALDGSGTLTQGAAKYSFAFASCPERA